jgi:hypothetical protein
MYRPKLAPTDYLLFLHIKKLLAGQRLRFDQDTKHILQDWLKGLAANFFSKKAYKSWSRDMTSALIYMATASSSSLIYVTCWNKNLKQTKYFTPQRFFISGSAQYD